MPGFADENKSVVCVIDDDDSVCRALCRLIRSSGMDAEGYATIDEFMAAPLPLHEPVCIVADVRLPQTSGLHLPEWLHRQGRNIPVVFVTAQDSAETRSAARKAGAAACFRKPVDDQALLDAIAWAAHKET